MLRIKFQASEPVVLKQKSFELFFMYMYFNAINQGAPREGPFWTPGSSFEQG